MPEETKTLDLNSLANSAGLVFSAESAEHPDERTSRLRREESDASHKRWQHTCLMLGAVLAALVLAGVCAWVVVAAKGGTEAQKWATSYLASLSTALMGYLVGKGAGAKAKE